MCCKFERNWRAGPWREEALPWRGASAGGGEGTETDTCRNKARFM